MRNRDAPAPPQRTGSLSAPPSPQTGRFTPWGRSGRGSPPTYTHRAEASVPDLAQPECSVATGSQLQTQALLFLKRFKVTKRCPPSRLRCLDRSQNLRALWLHPWTDLGPRSATICWGHTVAGTVRGAGVGAPRASTASAQPPPRRPGPCSLPGGHQALSRALRAPGSADSHADPLVVGGWMREAREAQSSVAVSLRSPSLAPAASPDRTG